MASPSVKAFGSKCWLYVLSWCLCRLPVAMALNIWHPFLSSGPFVSHRAATPLMGNQYTAFMREPPLFSSPVLNQVPVVRSNISLLLPGRIVPWWPAVGEGVQIQIDSHVNKEDKPLYGNKSPAKPCSSCGKSSSTSISPNFSFNPNDIHGLGTYRPRSVVVWPESNRLFNVSIVERGRLNAPDYHIYYQNEDGPISPMHDIPLFANEGNKIFNMVVEVPRWTNAKMEIATKDPLNPIKQDVKKGKLRYVANCFPHHGYIWNYGALPQTWEDPNHVDESSGCKGDNDPIDVCEIGYRVAKRGEVIQVKILGTIALIDEGETDWKLIAIDVNDPLAPQLSDISDVEKQMPGFLKATVEWFRIYKIPDGKPENQFAFNGLPKERDFAHKIIMETHEAWQHLVEGKTDAGGLNTGSVLIPSAVNKISRADAEQVVSSATEPGPALPMDAKVDLWHYVSLK